MPEQEREKDGQLKIVFEKQKQLIIVFDKSKKKGR